MTAPRLYLRLPKARDERQVRAAMEEFSGTGFPFMLGWDASEPFARWVERVTANERGEQLPAGWVPTSYLLGVVPDAGHEVVVGRSSIRYALNEFLLHEGGHVGYAVRPAHRRQGYATAILRQSVTHLLRRGITRVLVTCDDDNAGSVRVIEGGGGVLEDVRHRSADGTAVRRYWIDAVPTGGGRPPQ